MSYATDQLKPPSSYVQTAVITASGKVGIPAGTKRIEALLVGGGGGGSYFGGGFGGVGIFEIPVLGPSIDLVVGAGGASGNPGSSINGSRGGATKVSIWGTPYAIIGGGGGGCHNAGVSSYTQISGEYGGSGGGHTGGGTSAYLGGFGGTAPIGNLLWYPTIGKVTVDTTTPSTQLNETMPCDPPVTVGLPARYIYDGTSYWARDASEGTLGGGSGGSFFTVTSRPFGSGNGGPGGGGTGAGINGGSLASYSVWGITFGAAGAAFGSGGGGCFGASAASAASAGGLGGGGGGGSGASSAGGNGGDGGAVFRFYF